MNGKLYCGVSKKRITPSEELLPNLRGLMNYCFGGVIDELYVRTIVFDDGENKTLIVSYDLDKAPYPEENFTEIYELTGIPKDNILYFGTHTHTAPLTGKRPGFGKNRLPEDKQVKNATHLYEEFLKTTMLEAVQEAISSMQPAKMGFSTGKSYINVNRTQDYIITDENGQDLAVCDLGVNPEGPVDHTVFVMEVEDLEGNPIAFFVNFAVHCALMIWNAYGENEIGISGDIAGNVSQMIKKKFDGSVAIWSSGAAGDVNPTMLNQVYFPDPNTGENKLYKVYGLETALVMLKMTSTRHFADILKVIKKIDNFTQQASVGSVVEWSRTPAYKITKLENGELAYEESDSAEPYEIRMHLVKIGYVALMGISGELYSSLGFKIQEVSSYKNTYIINHDASMMAKSGYIFDDETIGRCAKVPAKYMNLPGATRGIRSVLGYVAPSLEKNTIKMFEKLF